MTDVGDGLSAQPGQPSTRRCPMCAEEIQVAARLCRFCGARFDDTVPPAAPQPGMAAPSAVPHPPQPGGAPYGQQPAAAPYGQQPGRAPYGQPAGAPYGQPPGGALYGQPPGGAPYGQPGSAPYGQPGGAPWGAQPGAGMWPQSAWANPSRSIGGSTLQTIGALMAVGALAALAGGIIPSFITGTGRFGAVLLAAVLGGAAALCFAGKQRPAIGAVIGAGSVAALLYLRDTLVYVHDHVFSMSYGRIRYAGWVGVVALAVLGVAVVLAFVAALGDRPTPTPKPELFGWLRLGLGVVAGFSLLPMMLTSFFTPDVKVLGVLEVVALVGLLALPLLFGTASEFSTSLGGAWILAMMGVAFYDGRSLRGGQVWLWLVLIAMAGCAIAGEVLRRQSANATVTQ